MRSSLRAVNIPVTNMDRAREFYSSLFGMKPARSLTRKVEAEHMPISRDGLQLTLTSRIRDNEKIAAYFGVKDLQGTIKELERLGGKLIYGPFELPVDPEGEAVLKEAGEKPIGSLGDAALLQDPDGNIFGLISMKKEAQEALRAGDPFEDLRPEQLEAHRRSVEHGERFKSKVGRGK